MNKVFTLSVISLIFAFNLTAQNTIMQPEKVVQTAGREQLGDFAPEFAEALSHADNTILTEIYPARELPIPGVTSRTILDRMTGNATLIERKDLLNKIKITNFEVLITLGAADLDVLLPEISEALKRDVEVIH